MQQMFFKNGGYRWAISCMLIIPKVLLTIRGIWLERNARVFMSSSKDLAFIVKEIKEECNLWRKKAGARCIDELLSSYWLGSFSSVYSVFIFGCWAAGENGGVV